jgi:hypothetical protein
MGFPVLDEINIYYEIVAAKALTIEVAPGGGALADKVPVLEDLVRLILGRDAAFLRRAPLAGIHGRPPGS